jgi:SWIM/SEC-C metal-binding protein
MPKLGSEQRPIIVRVTSEDRAHYVAQECQQNGWHYIIGFEGPEDISDLENALNPPLPMQSTKVERNSLCPCGSGRKYKKCCGSQANGSGSPRSGLMLSIVEPRP